jgi:hypothetical protein
VRSRDAGAAARLHGASADHAVRWPFQSYFPFCGEIKDYFESLKAG